MSTHVTRQQEDRLRHGKLPLAELTEVAHHATICGECRQSLQGLLPVDRVVRDLRLQIEAENAEHLSSESLMAFADETLLGTELEAAGLHLQECEICAGEVDEIRRLRILLPRRRSWIPYAVAASVAVIAAAGLLVMQRHTAPPPAPAPVRPAVPVQQSYEHSTWSEWVAEARNRQELPVPSILAELRGSKTQLRGSAEGDAGLEPDKIVVASARPQFRWSAPGRGATYKVILKSGRTVVESEALTEPRWTPSTDLKRGGEYEWQVEVTHGSDRRVFPRPPDPPARFRVLGQSDADEIKTAQERHPDDALLHVVIMARYGLRDEALAALDRLERQDARLAAALRDSLRKWSR